MWKYTIEVTGMMCGMCESHVNDAIRRAFPVKKVTSSHKKNRTEIITEQELDEVLLKKVITEQGYDMGSVQKQSYEKKGLFGLF